MIVKSECTSSTVTDSELSVLTSVTEGSDTFCYSLPDHKIANSIVSWNVSDDSKLWSRKDLWPSHVILSPLTTFYNCKLKLVGLLCSTLDLSLKGGYFSYTTSNSNLQKSSELPKSKLRLRQKLTHQTSQTSQMLNALNYLTHYV